MRKSWLLTVLMCGCMAWGGADRLMQVDELGVLRYKDNGEEVSLFGVNYYPPFSIDYGQLKDRGIDPKSIIHQDLAHFQRLGLNTLRLHTFEREFSDKDGNFLDNDHVDVLDFLIAECARRDIYVVLTPIAWWGSAASHPNAFASRYATIRDMIADHDAWGYMANFLEQYGRHVNRYTGKTYAEDPAIPLFELINEPLYKKDFPEQEITDYINALVAGLRKSGTTKPIFYSTWQHAQRPVSKANIQGVTHSWYPSGLVAGRTLTENYLPKVDYFSDEFHDPILANKAKMIYEFDCADIHQTTMYAAMARSFRNAGAQVAAQFQYEVLALADGNPNWQTHYLNLAYTPGKAIGFAIAAQAFYRLPRGFQYGRYPESCRFGNFTVSYEKDLAELVTETEFMYSNDTMNLPPKPEALTKVYGVGSSPLVATSGSGAYFLDRLADGEWLLEVYPDALVVRDPYSGGALEKVRLLGDASEMKIGLPNLGGNFTVERVDDGGRFKTTAQDGTVTLLPGQYRLMRQGLKASAKLPSREFVLPPISPKVKEIVLMPRIPSVCREEDAVINCTGIVPSGYERLEAVAVPADGNGAEIHVPLKQLKKAQFQAVIPKARLKPGVYRMWIEHEADGRTTVFPGGKAKKVVATRPGQAWPALALSAETPLPLNRDTEDGFHYTYNYEKDSQAARMSANGFGIGRAAIGMRFDVIPPPAGETVSGLRLRLRGSENTASLEIGVVHDGRHAYGMPFTLTPEWQDVEVNLGILPALWSTVEGQADAHKATQISLITGTWLFPAMREMPHWVEVQSAEWFYQPDESRMRVLGPDEPVILLEFENGLVPRAQSRVALSSWVSGREPLSHAWRWTAGAFASDGGADYASARPTLYQNFKKQLQPGTGKTLILRARGLYAWTNKVEMVLSESDGSAWGTNVELTPEWQDIRIPVEKLHLFTHWGNMPGNRGGEGDHLVVENISGCSFCMGKFLFQETYMRPHGLEIQELRLE